MCRSSIAACLFVLLAYTKGFATESQTLADTIERESRNVAGWTVHIDHRLIKSELKATATAITLLKTQLTEIVNKLPKPAVQELQKVPLYFSPAYPGVQPRAEFHPGAAWLRENGRDPMMEHAVEFTNITDFEAETVRMPNFALHELAHAYHLRVLKEGFGNPALIKAFEVATASGKYDRVERSNGVHGPNTFEKAYAMSTPMEYFAETTEAYFTRNDFYPFNSQELRKHDPEMFELLTELWGVENR